MIPSLNIVAWGATVPWAELRQVEQAIQKYGEMLELEVGNL